MDDVTSPVVMPRNPTLDEEMRVFQDLVSRITDLPEGAHRVEFHLGEDHAGDRAVWFHLVADDDLKPSKQKLAVYQRAIDKLDDQVRSTGTDRWPYFRIVAE